MAEEQDGSIPEGDKGDERDELRFWLRWIKRARDSKKSKIHCDRATEAWKEYENGSRDSTVIVENETSDPKCPIYWSSCETILPAYYSKTPKTLSKRRFEVMDDVAMTGSFIIERLSEFLIEVNPFDDCMTASVKDYVHAEKAALQVDYTADIQMVPEQVPLMPAGAPDVFVDEQGQPWEEEVQADPATGMFFGQRLVEKAVNKKCHLKPVCYDHIFHTPSAKTQEEITEIAIYFCLSKKECMDRFGEDKCKSVMWKEGAKTRKSYAIDQGEEENNDAIMGKYVEGYECWDKVTKKVRWVTEQLPEDFLDVKEDPYGLRGFFPVTKFIIGSKPSKHLYPTPAFTHLKPMAQQLHECTAKIYDLIDAIERRAIVDGDEDLVTALNAGSGMYVAAKNITNIMEKGGLDKMIYFVPVQELANAIVELQGLEDRFKNQFYEYFGLPDIMRGVTQQYETKRAQELKATAAHDRFKFRKRQISTLARDGIELLIDLALEMYTDDEIAEIVGFKFMPPEHQQRFPQALELLRNDHARLIRVDVDTFTMSFMDEQLVNEQTVEAVNMVVNGMQQVSRAAAENPDNPEFAQLALLTVQKGLETVAPGKEFQDTVKNAANMLIEKLKNPPPPPPPPPDYEMLKIQQKSQEAEMKNMQKSAELQQKQYKMEMDGQAKALEQQLTAKEIGVKEMKVALDHQAKNFDQKLDSLRLALEDMVARFEMSTEGERVMIERFKAAAQAAESQQEEIRLARESNLKIVEAAANIREKLQPIVNVPEIKMPEIKLQLEPPKRRGRKATITHDDGTSSVVDIPGDD